MKAGRFAAYMIVALFFVVALAISPWMPLTMTSHWGVNGEANGTMPKLIALFLVPVIALGLLILFEFLPRIDPLRKSYLAFMGEYEWFVAGILGFLLYVQCLVLAWNAGIQFDMVQALAPGFGVLFYIIGMLVGKTKRNWFVGVRTPWSMSSERVWDRTNTMAGTLFKAAGVIILLGVIFPGLLFAFMIVGIVLAAFVPFPYSYMEYKRLEREGSAVPRRHPKKRAAR